jgi:hypothetical protein
MSNYRCCLYKALLEECGKDFSYVLGGVARATMDQVRYFKEAKVAPLLNNMVRQLLIERPDSDLDVYGCLVRALGRIDAQLERGSATGRRMRFAMLPLPFTIVFSINTPYSELHQRWYVGSS